MVSILEHVLFYIIKYEWRGTGTVPSPVLTHIDKRIKMADHEENYEWTMFDVRQVKLMLF